MSDKTKPMMKVGSQKPYRPIIGVTACYERYLKESGSLKNSREQPSNSASGSRPVQLASQNDGAEKKSSG